MRRALSMRVLLTGLALTACSSSADGDGKGRSGAGGDAASHDGGSAAGGSAEGAVAHEDGSSAGGSSAGGVVHEDGSSGGSDGGSPSGGEEGGLDAGADADAASVPVVCERGQTFCNGDGDLLLCSQDGTSSVVQTACSQLSQHCVEGDASPHCEPNKCTPSLPVCDGNIATLCKPDGSGPMAGGMDCGPESACASGICMALLCKPNAWSCVNGNVAACDSSGFRRMLRQICGAGETCYPPTVECRTIICSAGMSGCEGEAFGDCNEWGTNYTVNPADCSAQGKICGQAGCSDVAVDEVGEAATTEQATTGTLYGNMLYVSQARTLTKIEMNLVLREPLSLTWVVYEQRVGGDYNLVTSATTTADQSSVYPGSGTLSALLAAGHNYMMGVYFAPATTSVDVHLDTSAHPRLPFASLLGTVAMQASAVPESFSAVNFGAFTAYNERLTTAPP